MIRILLLFCIVAQLAPQVQSLRSIDWKRCSVDAKCYIEGKCNEFLNPYPTKQAFFELRELKNNKELLNGKCNVGIQLIPLSAKKVLIYMQVIGEDLDSETIGLYQKDKHIVGCNMTDGKVDVFHESSLIKKGKPVLYEDFSRFSDKYAFCAVTIDKYDKFFEAVKTPAPLTQSVLKFKPRNPTPRPAGVTIPTGEYPYATTTLIYEILPSDVRICDPSAIKPAAPRQNYHVLQVKDPARGEIDCSNYKEALHVDYEYRLFIQQGENHTEAAKLECDYTTKKYKEITDQTDISAYCAVEMSKTCTNTFNCTSSIKEECPTFKKGTATENSKLECTDGKWLIAGEYFEEIHPECKDDEMIPNNASFYITYPGGGTKLSEGQCFVEYDCRIKSRIDTSANVEITADKISCLEGEMRVKHGTITYNETEYHCNTTTGLWTNKDTILPPNSRVMCEKRALVAASTGSFGVTVAISLGAAILSIPIALFSVIGGYGLYDRRDHLKVIMYITFWRIIPRNTKVRFAAEAFDKLLHAKSDSSVKIITGLKLIECLLRTETEDPEVWEFAYPFLTRFHGASRARGNRLTGLFTRYLYLAAKRIIDKHGWISPNKITRTQYKGYIRTVAIRLIFYCRFNHYTEEVTKFIGEGFNKLRYDAAAQYPHCGMLWSHVATSRNRFMQKQFLADLDKISDGRELMEISEEDRFPEIGSIGEQAMAAIGGSIFYKGRNQFPKMQTHGLGYIKGVMRSSHLDMGIIMRVLFARTGHSVLDSLVPKNQDAFLGKVMLTMICYGQPHEAKILENAYVHHTMNRQELKRMPPSDRFSKMEKEQELFEKALSEEEKSIINWLAARMDKKELRKNGPGFATSSCTNDNDNTGASKSGKETNEPYTAKSGLASDDSFFAALLQEPIVIPRIRTCQATEEEQKRYKELLAEIFSDDTLIVAWVNFVPDVIAEITDKVEEIIKTEPMLIEDIPGGITVVSNLHGQLYDLHRVFKADSIDGKPGYECTKYLFMGDYVDRGHMSLEVVMTLFILKILYPDRIFLLRGNHEFVGVNALGGFHDEMFARFEKYTAVTLYVRINKCFCFLSVAGIVGDKFFCAHAGISIGSFNRYELRRLEKPYLHATDDVLLNDVVWSDPALRLKGICFNEDRQVGIMYGEDEFIHALENIGCEALFRGHTIISPGYQKEWNRLFCIFTATGNDKHSTGKGAVALIDENLAVKLRVFECDLTRNNVEKEFLREKKAKKDQEKEEGEKQSGGGELPQEETFLADDPDKQVEESRGSLSQGTDY